MTRMNRRQVVAGGAAFVTAPLVPGRARAASVDVVVVGAGAAGIAATRTLRRAGLSATLIEASGRIGGRVFTDTRVFGQPYDIGAHWLHSEHINPFVAYGRAQGFDVYRAPSAEVLYVDDRRATSQEVRAYGRAYNAARQAMLAAGEQGKDVSPASIIPDLGEWEPTVNYMAGSYNMAKDFDSFSTADWYTGEGGEDAYCREGFGALFAHSARDTEAELGVRAQVIRYGDQGVEVVTDQGSITARGVICTVSMGVLKAGHIRFDPPLPDAKQEAIEQLTMGHYNHVALQFRDNFFGIGADGYFTYKIEKSVDGDPQGFAALVDASGTGISYCDLCGEFARQMALEGKPAALDFVLTELNGIFGSKVEAALVAYDVTDWSTDPLFEGGFAAAEPSGAGSRGVMRAPVADRLWFAGEAMALGYWATVAGAHFSGELAAREVNAVLSD
ncbi:MAG: FAD-dependent oxidoreductase [Pseudomonadota bacterium]